MNGYDEAVDGCGVALSLAVLRFCVCVRGGTIDVKDFAEFQNALASRADRIKLTADITLTESVTVDYKVHIELNGHFINSPNEGSNVQLIIAEGTQVTIGVDVANVTNTDFSSGGVRVNVENHGYIVGSAAFYGRGTNYGSIDGADCFYGEYVPMSGSVNASYCTLTLDMNGYVPASTPEGWTQQKDQLVLEILCGQKLPQGLSSISRTGLYLWRMEEGGWYAV